MAEIPPQMASSDSIDEQDPNQKPEEKKTKSRRPASKQSLLSEGHNE